MAGHSNSPAADTFMAALEAGDMAAALAVVEGERAAGRSLVEIAVGPAQVKVGERWQTAAWSVAEEHAASAISEAILHLLGGSLSNARRERRPVVLTCAENEWHTIPALLAATGLRESGWRVVYLGASMPADHLAGFLTANRPLALAISCSLPLNLPGVRRQVAQAHALGVPVVAGGRAFDRGGRRGASLGVDAVASAGEDVNGLLERWAESVPTLAVPKPAPFAEVASGVRANREGFAANAFTLLEAAFPAMATYDLRQRTRTLEDLAYTLDFLATALDVDDPTVLTEYLGWLSELLGARRVPRVVVGKSVQALVESLAILPAAQSLLSDAAAVLLPPVPEATSAARRRRPKATADGADQGFSRLIPTIRSEWERRAAINAGALAVVEALAGIADPVVVAETFTRTVAEELALATAVVGVPLTGAAATLAASDDPNWVRHPPHSLPDVVAALTGARPKGFRFGGADALVVPVAVGATTRVALVASGFSRAGSADAALTVTVLAKVLGQALRAANLEIDSRAKAAFLGILGHELRTPLTSILGYAELLDGKGPAALGERERRHVKGILAGGNRLLTLVEDVLDLVALESGDDAGRASTFPLRPLLLEVAGTDAGAARGVSVSIRCTPDLNLRTGRHHLARALGNVVANAVRFSPGDGVVRVSVRRGRAECAIRIRDEGPGIDPRQVALLGQPFLQLSRGFTRTHDGLGLGLATARAHVAAIGGHLTITSSPGRGTTVAIVLPVAAVQAATTGVEGARVRG